MRIVAISLARVVLLPEEGLVRLDSSLSCYAVTREGEELLLYVRGGPDGLVSDGASVPAPLWAVLEASPLQLLLMGLLHDAAYRVDQNWLIPHREAGLHHHRSRPIARPEADDLAQAVALWSGCSTLDGMKIRYGVGVGGAGAWHCKRCDWRPDSKTE